MRKCERRGGKKKEVRENIRSQFSKSFDLEKQSLTIYFLSFIHIHPKNFAVVTVEYKSFSNFERFYVIESLKEGKF